MNKQSKFRCTIRAVFSVFTAFLLLAGTAVAGPPLVCHAYDIGDAKSLPWISHDWNLSGSENYDTRNLAEDTLAILKSSDVPLVHMETLRRATLYARKDPRAAKQLLLQMIARAESSSASTHPDAFAMLDAAYIIESYKQWLNDGGNNPAQALDGVAWIEKAMRLRGDDAQFNFAAAMITLHAPYAGRAQYAQKALEGGKRDALLSRNLDRHFLGAQSPTIAELLLHGGETKVARQ